MTTHFDQTTDSATPPPPPGYSPPTTGPSQAKSPWYRRTWVAVAAALLVGVGIGAAGGGDPTTSAEYQAVVDERDAASATAKDLGEKLAEAEASLEEAEAEVESIAGDLPDREADLEAAQARLADAQRELKSRESKLQKREKSVTAREKKVGIVETRIRNNTISGEGMYQVGVDIKPGLYKTTGQPGCYYAVLNSPDTFDIENNNNIDGPGVLSVRDGQYLMLSGCAKWVWQN